MTAVVTTLRILTTITSVLLCVSPWPDYRRIIREKNTGPLSMLPVLMLFINCYMWCMYAYLVDNFFPLFACCAFGCSTCLVFMSIFYRWSTEKPKLNKLIAVAVVFVACWTAYVIVATAGVTGQTDDGISKILGYMCVAVNIGVYASPLDVMKTVVKTKNAEALPISLCTMNLINGSLWVVFGAVTADYFVLTPNALGAVLSAVQVGLYVKYRPAAAVGAMGDDVMNTKGSVVITLSPSELPKSPAFHQIGSPQ
jgi:solute carrier family 50 protein (sugar transporter)